MAAFHPLLYPEQLHLSTVFLSRPMFLYGRPFRFMGRCKLPETSKVRLERQLCEIGHSSLSMYSDFKLPIFFLAGTVCYRLFSLSQRVAEATDREK